MADVNELLSCPFCGNDPLDDGEVQGDPDLCMCTKEGCGIQGVSFLKRDWQVRASHPPKASSAKKVDLRLFEKVCAANERTFQLNDDKAGFHDIGALRGYVFCVLQAYEESRIHTPGKQAEMEDVQAYKECVDVMQKIAGIETIAVKQDDGKLSKAWVNGLVAEMEELKTKPSNGLPAEMGVFPYAIDKCIALVKRMAGMGAVC